MSTFLSNYAKAEKDRKPPLIKVKSSLAEAWIGAWIMAGIFLAIHTIIRFATGGN